MRSRKGQAGVALITAILLVAMATLLTTKLAWDYQISLRRTEAALVKEQARFFAIGAEAVAIDVLLQDDETFDHAGEDWALVVPPMDIGIDEISMGQMQGSLHDAQGRFNLNNLVPVRGAEPDKSSREQFARLVEILQLDPGIVDAVIDWIDEDTVPLANGAEDSIYTALDPPYRPANNYFTSVTELRAVANVDAESYAALLPHVTAIHPEWCGATGGITPININSASAAVIEALHEDIDQGQAEAWFEERGEGKDATGWENLNQIPGWPAEYSSLPGTPVMIKSNCFGLNVLVNVGSSVLSMYSLLDRSASTDKIVTRVRIFGLD
jgi:general secretion pathway protein K